MKFKHQKLLIFEGSAGATTSPTPMSNTLVSVVAREKNFLVPSLDPAAKMHSPLEQSLQLVRRAMLLIINTITQLQQADLLLIQCFTHNILDARSDEVGSFYFGYKNYSIYLYVKTREHQLYLTINSNYINTLPLIQTC